MARRTYFSGLILDVHLCTESIVMRGAQLTGERSGDGKVELAMETRIGSMLLWADPRDLARLMFLDRKQLAQANARS